MINDITSLVKFYYTSFFRLSPAFTFERNFLKKVFQLKSMRFFSEVTALNRLRTTDLQHDTIQYASG